jgi:hypothetical protein
MLSLMLAQKIKQTLGLAGPRPQVNVGEEDGTNTRHGRIVPCQFDRAMTTASRKLSYGLHGQVIPACYGAALS